MPVPEIDYDQQAQEMLPTEQRKQLWIVFVRAMGSAVKWLYNLFQGYRKGEDPDPWDATVTYAAYDKVKYKFSTYESITSSNLGAAPDANPDKWLLRNASFIGAMSRAKYRGEKIVFESALNKNFGTEFRQPPLTSDIYIANDTPTELSFVMYPSSASSSKMYPDDSTGYMFESPVYGAVTTFKFIIHVPTAVYAVLGVSAEQIIREFADRYNYLGLEYTIETY